MRGSITRTPAGTYRLRVEGPRTPDGQRRYITRTIRGDRTAAEQALHRLLVEVGAGQHIGTDATITQTVEAWMHIAHLEATTRRDYRSAIDLHIAPHLGTMKVHQVRASHLDRLYRDLGARGLGPARIRRVHTILSAAFAQAVKWEWIARNPTRDASPPEVPRTRVIAPTVEQVRAIIDAAAGELVTWLRLDASTGARRGEVCALRWCDLDLTAREVRLPHALADGGPGVGIVRKATKTGIVRTVAIDPATATALQEHRRMVLERAIASGVHIGTEGYVFSRDAAGITPWRPDYPTKQFARLRASLGLPDDLKMRTLRHFVATQMLAAGVDPRTVAGRLGHAKPSTTLDIYAAFLPARDRGAADALGELLG
jgi:integrase